MADQTIFELIELLEADVAEDDVLLIGDLSTTGTKKVLKSALFKKLATSLWEAGVSTQHALITPAQLTAAINALSSGGPWTLLGTYEPTSGSILEITDFDLSSHNDYILDIRGLMSTSDASLTMQVSHDGGSNWVAGTNYHSSYIGWEAGSSDASVEDATSDDRWILTDQNFAENLEAGSDSTGLNGLMLLNHFGNSDNVRPSFTANLSYLNRAFDNFVGIFTGYVTNNSNIDAVRIIADSGNFNQGIVRLYGVNES